MIYDTPGLFDTQDGHDVIKAEIARAIQMASPGPHAFLILFKIGNRFTDEEKKTIETIQDMFGKDADQFCILLLTGEDNLIHDGKKVEDYLETANPGLKQLLEQCQNRYITINNRPLEQAEVDKKLQQLVEMIETMLAKNQVRYYTDEQFQKAEQKLQEREKQLIEAEMQKKKAEEKALHEKVLQNLCFSIKLFD
jgi:ATP-dependent Lon protease